MRKLIIIHILINRGEKSDEALRAAVITFNLLHFILMKYNTFFRWDFQINGKHIYV